MKEKFSLKEKQDYHFKMCKVGATKIDKKTGQLVKVSDFERGAHCARANSILDYRRKCKTGEIKLKKNFKEKPVKPLPSWFNDYESNRRARIKEKNSSSNDISLEELDKFFNKKKLN